jgi:hypothetical protein
LQEKQSRGSLSWKISAAEKRKPGQPPSHLIQFLRDKLARSAIRVVDFNKSMFNLRRYLIPGIKGYPVSGAQKPK